MSTTTYPASYRFEPPAASASLSRRWLAIGLVAAIAAIAGGFASSQQFFRGYLIGYMLVLGFSLGSMALLMLGHLTGGNWWMIGRRVMEAAVGNIPLLTILFLPIWLGRHSLYIWLDPAYVASASHGGGEGRYLNDQFWTRARGDLLCDLEPVGDGAAQGLAEAG